MNIKCIFISDDNIEKLDEKIGDTEETEIDPITKEQETKVDDEDEDVEDDEDLISETKSESNDLRDDVSNEASSEMSNDNECDVEVQEVTMDIGPQNASENAQNEIVTHDSHYFPGGHRATYGLMLAQGHLYFRSWNELQVEIPTH